MYSLQSLQPRSRFHLNYRALLVAVALFGIELSIATVWSPIGWLRGFVGDVLAVVLVYYGLKSLVRAPPLPLAFAALLVGYGMELAQYLSHLAGWQISQPILRTLVGSTPDWWDILAYTLGFGVVLIAERLFTRRDRVWSVAS
jgi:Protein of unknown function (DUF2809)